MVDYIVHDFEKGRTTLDDSIGAMIVCDSAPQARAVSEQLSRIAKYSHALVLHDEGTKQDRKDIQEDFKKGKIDILVVYNMLLTGFDAPRLKKQYLPVLTDHIRTTIMVMLWILPTSRKSLIKQTKHILKNCSQSLEMKWLTIVRFLRAGKK